MIKVYINNEEVVCDKSFTIKEELLSTSSIILNNVMPKSWYENNTYTNQFYLPEDYSKCEIYDDTTLLFEGVVRNTGNISLNPYQLKMISLEVLGYKCLLSEGKCLNFVIDNKTISEAIQMVVDDIQDYGFEVGTININSSNDLIGAYSTQDKTAYDVLQYLSEIAGCKWFVKRVGDNLSINFYDKDKIPQANDIEYNKEYWEQNNIVDMTYSFNTKDYRNSQTITSSGVMSNALNSEVYIFKTGDTNVITDLSVGKVQKIEVNDVEATVGTSSDKELGIDADFYYTIGSNEIEINDSLTNNDKIEITYYPFVKGRQLIENTDEINRITNLIERNGKISRYETRNDISSNEELNKIARSYLDYKGKAEVQLKIKTLNKDILNIGQQVNFNAPIEDIKGNYLVKKKEIEITKTGNYGNVFYTYTLSNTYNGEQAINFFDNQRRKNEGNIQEGSFITRYVDYNFETTIIFENLQITEQSNTIPADLPIEL
jgi:hypothetical protein